MLVVFLLALQVQSLAALPDFTHRYRDVPEYYRRQFESVDRFSAIVEFVRDLAQNETVMAQTLILNQSRFPLAAFAKSAIDSLQYRGFEESQRALLSMANLLNYIYQLSEKEFEKWFNEKEGHNAYLYSVVSSVVASDSRVFGCYVAQFDRTSMPHAYRKSSGTVLIDNYAQDVYKDWNQPGFEWLAYHKKHNQSLLRRIARRPSQKLSYNKAKNLHSFTAKYLRPVNNSDVKVVTENEGFWGPPVFIKKFRKWLISYAVPFLYYDDRRQLSIKGWIVLEFDLMRLEVNQCNNESTFQSFYSTNVCNQATTECVHIPGQGFTELSFNCKCKRYFHYGNFTGDMVRQQYLLQVSGQPSNYSKFECGPCPANCPSSCTTDGRCLIKYDLDTLRALPLVIQTFCLTVCVLVAGIVFKARRNRVIKSSVWILLEIFIVGVSLLYTTVFLMYVRPAYEICFVMPWLREIGFAITYGTMLVKVYRVLCSFQSRKAHRVHVRDRDLLKYLAGIVAVAVGFMAAWTAATLDHGRRLTATLGEMNCSGGHLGGHLILEDGSIPEKELGFRVCAIGYWDAVCAVAELAFLVLGLFYCYCIRSAPSDFSETRCITAAFCCELTFSLVYHVARHFVWNSLHPDYVYLMYFGRCHLTVTVTAALILGPKLWYVHSPPKNSLNNRSLMYSQVDSHLGEAMSPMAMTTNGDLDTLEINLTDMNPEDIRAELKRLYTQLQIFKTKVMRRENPHISKRKGGRKQTHRRFSLQPFYHKHSHKHPTVSVQEEEISKVSEDSSNSVEGAEGQERPVGKESTTTSSSSGSK